MLKLDVVVEGRSSAKAQGCEMIVLGWSENHEAVRFAPGNFSREWQDLADADFGNGRRSPLAMKCEGGRASWEYAGDFALFVIVHPWSGLVRASTGEREAVIDLYSERTDVRRLDPATMRLEELSPVEADELAFALDRLISEDDVRAWTRRGDAGEEDEGTAAERDEARLAAAIAHGDDDEDAWVLIGIGPVLVEQVSERGKPVDLATRRLTPPNRPFSGQEEVLEAADGGGWHLRGEVRLRLRADARLVLRGEPGGGTCLVDTRHGLHRFALHREKAEAVPVDGTTLGQRARPRHFLIFDEDRRLYPDLVAGIDPDKPVALHVPRWKGVASSTLNLFEQRLPVPLHSNTPPEAVTEADIERYARLLLDTGARHFVISGGDTFFIKLIRKVQERAPAIRFDLYWHSNWVALGSSHDWWIFRQWLAAYAEGLVTRIAVAKEGLDTFLAGYGVDSVFIRNVIVLDPQEIRPSRHNGTAGIWLSRSDDYRKLPHASLAALGQLRKYPLKASGLNYVARRLIDIMDLPIHRIWAEPIPRMQLYCEMSEAALTLYVTLSECSPMLPLESFALGVPCIVGPSSHLFRDDAWLRQMLVAEDPLNPGLIAEKVEGVVAERDTVIARYRDYAAWELADAKAAVARLVA